MPTVTSFYITANTGVDYEVSTYTKAAGDLANVMAQAFTRDSLTQLLGEHTSADVDIEVSLENEPRELVVKAVVDVLAEERVKLDKTKLSKCIKGLAGERPKMKVFTQGVPQKDSSSVPSDHASASAN